VVLPNVEALAVEYRGDLLDTIQYGYYCVVDENGKVVLRSGDPDARVFYRSASKPVQALPTLMKHLDEKYGLTDEETAIFAASHKGEPFHVRVLESVMKKTGLREEDMIMNASAPGETYAYDGNPRKIYHNCSGKHLSLMLLQRELTGSVEGYHLPDSPAQILVKQTIAAMSGCDESTIGMAIDGCGVPVFSVLLKEMATAFLNLACPDLVKDPDMARAAKRISTCMNEYPELIRGSASICLTLNKDTNIVGKSGANGVYCLGLKKERLGIAIKLIDGKPDWLTFVVRGILQKLNYENPEMMADLESQKAELIMNDTNQVVGHREFL